MTGLAILRHLLAILVLPFVVVVVVPRWLMSMPGNQLTASGGRLGEVFLQLVGAVIFVIGLSLFAWCVTLFARRGKGTLAPWDPTQRLVAVGPYRHVRNPMITGVALMLAGEAAFFQSIVLAQWLAVFVVFNHLYFLAVEEPGLAHRFPQDYPKYRANVPRWIPSLDAYSEALGRRALLDGFMREWDFHEHHAIEIAAPPPIVFEAIRLVRAGALPLYGTLTWIRRGGRSHPAGILDPPPQQPLIDAALNGGFILLADDEPREIVIGTIVICPRGQGGQLSPRTFTDPLPKGFAIAAMNFLITPLDDARCLVSTETRVKSGDPSTRRKFAAYWRMIRPGSAFIRIMWLRAIRRRARDAVEGQNG